MMKKNIKKLLFVTCALALASMQLGKTSYNPVMAVEQGDIDDAQQNIEQKEEEIRQLNEELSELSSNIEDTQSYITELDGMLAELTTEVNECQAKIDAKQAQIDAKQIEINNTQTELEEAQAQEKDQYESMSYRIQYMYECGDETFLDMIFSAEDLSDLLGRSEYISSITSYDRQQLENLVATKENINSLLEKLETEIAELDAEKVVLEDEKAVLDELMVDISYKQASVDAVLETKQSTLQILESQQAYTEEQKAAAEQELKDLEKIHASLQAMWEEEHRKIEESGGDPDAEAQKTLEAIGLAGGFTWPLPGYNTITSEYGMRTNPVSGVYMLHDGFDISGYAVNGKPIVAAYGGTVILSEYYWGYGNCIQISHGSGVVTLYAHCSSLAVKVGDVVSAGQVIGYVGTTGNSTGPHLHFSIFIQGKAVNPRDYITIPS